MVKYIKVYLLLAKYSFQTFFVSRVGAVLFFTGKVLRFVFFFLFLLVIFSETKVLSGYDFWQVSLFYMTFNFIDSATQMLFREVYRFRSYILSGSFDMFLLRPVNVLFRSLFGWTDLLDFLTLVPFIVMIFFIMTQIPDITITGIALYFVLIFNSLLIAASFHISVLSLAVMTTEIDHAVLIYRDLSGMGRVPIDVYKEPLRSFITFVIPVGIMMAFPVKMVFGMLNVNFVMIAFSFSAMLLFLSLNFWKFALKRYTSASS